MLLNIINNESVINFTLSKFYIGINASISATIKTQKHERNE